MPMMESITIHTLGLSVRALVTSMDNRTSVYGVSRLVEIEQVHYKYSLSS